MAGSGGALVRLRQAIQRTAGVPIHAFCKRTGERCRQRLHDFALACVARAGLVGCLMYLPLPMESRRS